MLRWAIIFAIIALVAGAFGFVGLEGTAAYLARIFAVIFVILFVVSLIFGRRAIGGPSI